MPRAVLILIAFGALAFASAVGVLLQLSGPPVIASSGALSEHDLEAINAMSAHDQAKFLLEKTINHYKGAPEEIARRVDGWTGQIQKSKEIDSLTNTAYFSSDLRVRAAALEIWLAQYGFHKTAEAVDGLIRDVSLADDQRYFRLSNLGILGNRGVEPEKVFQTLALYLHDPDPSTRSGAINGLGLLGTESTIAALLDRFHNDTSYDLRERAACNLADSGMLTRELRQKAVPELLRFSQDPQLDATTKKWVYQALREITQKSLPDDPATWANWYGARAER